jgi:hypothetical protein
LVEVTVRFQDGVAEGLRVKAAETGETLDQLVQRVCDERNPGLLASYVFDAPEAAVSFSASTSRSGMTLSEKTDLYAVLAAAKADFKSGLDVRKTEAEVGKL